MRIAAVFGTALALSGEADIHDFDIITCVN